MNVPKLYLFGILLILEFLILVLLLLLYEFQSPFLSDTHGPNNAIIIQTLTSHFCFCVLIGVECECGLPLKKIPIQQFGIKCSK
jgi:hypothetical protein